MRPADRLAEAIKQADIVRDRHPLDPETNVDLDSALQALRQARARYERATRPDDEAEMVD